MTKDQAVSLAGDRLAALDPCSRRTFFATLLVLTAGCAGPVVSLPATRPAISETKSATRARIDESFARAEAAAAEIRAILDARGPKRSEVAR